MSARRESEERAEGERRMNLFKGPRARILAAASVLLVVISGIALIVGFPGGVHRAAGRTGLAGQFITVCPFSHRAKDDPIVFPGQPGLSHSHDFLGNRSTNARSTLDSLRAERTTCVRSGDRSAYWVPTLYVKDRAVTPEGANVYYRTAARDPASIRPFPQGLKVIAGSHKARRAQDPRIMHWSCAPVSPVDAERGRRHRRKTRKERVSLQRQRRALKARRDQMRTKVFRRRLRALRRELHKLNLRSRREATATRCRRGASLKLTITFPECWDGRRLDSADHKSHLAYARRSRYRRIKSCPQSHPVPVPQLIVNVLYPTRGGRKARLASGSLHSAHADFFNAWNERGLADLVRRCVNADIHCHRR